MSFQKMQGDQGAEKDGLSTRSTLWGGRGRHLEEADCPHLHPAHEGKYCPSVWQNPHISRCHLGGGNSLSAETYECTLTVNVVQDSIPVFCTDCHHLCFVLTPIPLSERKCHSTATAAVPSRIFNKRRLTRKSKELVVSI